MSVDLPGFTAPVEDAQSTFRAILTAMSRPGQIVRATGVAAPPPTLSPATAAVLLTLVDADAPLRCGDAFASARDWIAFHCGTRFDGEPAFILENVLPDLALLPQGDDEEPEASATVILQVAALGTGRAYRIAGPGLAAPATLRVEGLPDDFVARWALNHAGFPRGVDLVLCADEALAALPRSVTVSEG